MGFMQGISEDLKSKMPALTKFYGAIKSEEGRKKARIAFQRVVCLDPDHLSCDDVGLSDRCLQAISTTNAVLSAPGQGAGHNINSLTLSAIKSAPLKHMIARAPKLEWSDICASRENVQSFFADRSDIEEPDVDDVLKFLGEVWELLQAVYEPKERVGESAKKSQDERRANGVALASMFHDFVSAHLVMIDKKGHAWHKEAARQFISPFCNPYESYRNANKRPAVATPAGELEPPSKKPVKKVDPAVLKRWESKYLELAQEERKIKARRPYDPKPVGDKLMSAATSTEDQAAVRVTISRVCKNCLFADRIETGHKKKCPEVQWYLNYDRPK